MSIITDKTGEQTRGKAPRVEIAEYQARLELFYEVAQQASSVAELSELLEEILQVTQRILQASASSLLLINEEKGQFYLQAAGGEKSSALRQITLTLDSGIIGWVARNGQPIMTNNAYHDERFNKNVDEATGFVTRSIIAAPIKRGTNVIGVLEIVNRVDGNAFTERDSAVLAGFAATEAIVLLVSMASTAINNIKLCEAMQEEYRSTVATLAKAADAKDPYASGHSRRVKEYVLLAADTLGLSPEARQAIEYGAVLHDIGKIGISDNILLKAGPLTTGEWYIMRKHSLRGANIVSEIPCLAKARDVILYHHERYDGKGYPAGLTGEEIPIDARLVAVADAFDTMTTDHSYRAALTVDEAMSELIKGSGTQFCPVAVDAFITGFQKREGRYAQKEAQQEAGEEIKREAEEKLGQDFAEKLRREVEARAKQKAEEEAQREAGEKAKREAEEQLRREAEERVKQEAEEERTRRKAGERLRREAEARLKREAEAERARREAEEKAGREAEDRSRREAEAERARKDAEEKARIAAEEKLKREAEERAKKTQEAEKSTRELHSEMYLGDVLLAIESPVGFEQVNQFKKYLGGAANLKIVMISWTEDEGTAITVALPQPAALGRILSEIPIVAQVLKKGKSLTVTLKDPQAG